MTDALYFCGKPVDEMTRDELVHAVKVLAQQIEGQRRDHRNTLDTWEASIKARERGFRWPKGAPEDGR